MFEVRSVGQKTLFVVNKRNQLFGHEALAGFVYFSLYTVEKVHKLDRNEQATAGFRRQATVSHIRPRRQPRIHFLFYSSIINCVQENETLILIGETGSGKSTQIPQFLLDGGLLSKGMVAVSQPRRVAAITLSKRVAQERSRQLGDVVGYIKSIFI